MLLSSSSSCRPSFTTYLRNSGPKLESETPVPLNELRAKQEKLLNEYQIDPQTHAVRIPIVGNGSRGEGDLEGVRKKPPQGEITAREDIAHEEGRRCTGKEGEHRRNGGRKPCEIKIAN